VEVWQASNVRLLRLGEEKRRKKERRNRTKMKCPHLLRRGAYKNQTELNDT